MDHLGPLPVSGGKQHVIVLIDGLTKVVVLEAVKTTDSKSVIRFLEKTFLNYGNPERLVSDRGTAFTSRKFETFLQQKGIAHSLISTQFPQSNGVTERANKEVARLLRTLSEKADKSDWALKVPIAQAMLNRTVARGTGKAPFEALHGYLPRVDNFSQVIEGLQESLWKPAETIREEIRKEIEKTQEECRNLGASQRSTLSIRNTTRNWRSRPK